jgi:hypothetical protein
MQYQLILKGNSRHSGDRVSPQLLLWREAGIRSFQCVSHVWTPAFSGVTTICEAMKFTAVN